MRHAVVGLWVVLAFLLAIPLAGSTAHGQIRGEVESIGFGGNYRPDCWTPMVVRIRTAGLDPALYKLQVFQEDLDRDRQAFTRTISIDPSQAEQRFWMYFIPQPGGLPDTNAGGSLDALRRSLRVQLTTANNRGIGQLAQTQVPTSLDGPPNEPFQRGQKLVLVVAEGNHAPSFREYVGAFGVSEDIVPVLVRPRELPENAIAYSAVDAILWLNADAAQLDEGGARRSAAIEQYVHQGGRLIVCQPPERDRLLALARLLPIEYATRTPGGGNLFDVEIRDSKSLEPLRSLARENASTLNSATDPWRTIAGPYRMAIARPKLDAMVEERLLIDWPDGTTSPWIVRGVVGLGGVTWVAQDLGDPALTARTSNAGWSRVWDTVFGWNNDTMPQQSRDPDDNRGYGEPTRAIDLGYALLRGMDHPGRGVQLVLLAVVFFVLYWVAAGPGSYFALLNFNKRELSWLAFAAAALVATVVTMGVVRLVVRGDPAIKHATVLRTPQTGPAIASSRIGLYIPNDGSIPVTLGDVAPRSLASVTAFAEHPQQRRDTERPPVQGEYVVPVPDETAEGAPIVPFPYRSTLKKVQATWVGEPNSRITGSARLSNSLLRGVDGVLTNNTGGDLRFAYIAFRNAAGQVRVFYKEGWRNGTSIDFARDLGAPPVMVLPPGMDMTDRDRRLYGLPRDGRREQAGPLMDILGTGRGTEGWTGFWFPPLRGRAGETVNIAPFDDADEGYLRSLPVLAMFDLVPTPRNRARDDFSRFEILRRGLRQINLSHVVTNGQMLVLAVSTDRRPLPFPLLVDGDPYGGDGDVIYETVIALNRTLPEPVTVPATQKVEDRR
jgi:hypothetical protein